MGKKVSQAPVKITKSESNQFKSLIKVLKPKVYIIDSSDFKTLVQELTGNGSTTTSSLPPPFLETKEVDKIPVIDIEDQRENGSRRVEVSTDVSIDDSSNEEFNQVWHQMCLYDNALEDSIVTKPVDHLFTYQELESLLLDEEPYTFYNGYKALEEESIPTKPVDHPFTYQELESLLLDVEPYTSYNSYGQMGQEVSIYDYEFAGLI
ncbi:VQ motif containing protein [Quillaja saponaria]|uniref:VQ motif containing protein n=1 Tax=Quillaja saponaria TaxID=32244 RepID=A0AAD7LM37_QUISA|nr:VQ motif containing protein [Quillaja saponaria]